MRSYGQKINQTKYDTIDRKGYLTSGTGDAGARIAVCL